jgi:outer membrane receptor for ferrienterochelin and colicins
MTVSTRTRAASFAGMLALSSSAWAQPLPDLSLERLMTLDAGQVFGASERLQPAIEAPASVSFITADEIARYGYRTLAEILRSVRGVYVVDDRNYSVVGMRGFALPGDYNSRMLLLINGHRVNDNVYGQAEVGAEFGLDPAMIERVEIIRGPASSVYGASAFFMVVNVITKSGRSLGGAAMTLEAGTLGTQLARASVGHRFANGAEVALSGTLEHTDGVGRLYFPEFDAPGTNQGVAEGLDGQGIGQYYGQLSFNGLTLTSAYGSRRRDVPTASFGSMFNEQASRLETTDRHTLVAATYGRSFRGTSVTLRTSFDRFDFDGTYPLPGDPVGAPPLVGINSAVGSRWTAAGGVTRTLGRHTVKVGVELIDNFQQDQMGRYVDPAVVILDRQRSSKQQAVYAQDEIKVTPWLMVNAGLRYDRYDEFRRVTPRAALIVMPSSSQSVKYLYGRAFRAPNEFELNDFFFGADVVNLRPEGIDTHELVWERYFNDRLRTSASTYWYEVDRLITLVPNDATFLGLSFGNQGAVRAKGLELEAQVRLRGESRVQASYALQSAVDQLTERRLPNSPRHIATARISHPGPARSTISAEGQYFSSRQTLAGSTVSGAAVVNATVVVPLGRAWEITGTVRNIFDAQYRDPVSSQHRQEAILQNGRTARIGLRWRLWD